MDRLTRRALLRRGGLALLAGTLGLAPLRRAAAAPTLPELTKYEPELDPDWRRANDEYWAGVRAFEAANARFWADPQTAEANAYYWRHLAPGAPEPLPAPEPATPVPTGGLAIANLALRYLGCPYRWGGESPAGWDCSGMVLWLARQFGIPLPRTAAQQYAATARVASPEPGDLVFFSYGAGIEHVGVVVGGGQMVSALSSALGTRSSQYSGAYWRPFVRGFGRIV